MKVDLAYSSDRKYLKNRVWRPVYSLNLKSCYYFFVTSHCDKVFTSVFEIFSCARTPTSQSKKAGPKIKRSPYLKFQGRSQGQLKNRNFDISSKPIVIIMTKPFLLCWNPLFILLVISFWMLNYWRLFLGRSLQNNVYRTQSFNPALVGRGIVKRLFTSLWIPFPKTCFFSFYSVLRKSFFLAFSTSLV